MILDQNSTLTLGRVSPPRNDIIPLHPKPNVHHNDPEVNHASSADNLVEQFELLDVNEAEEAHHHVDSLEDGLSDDSEEYLPGGNSDASRVSSPIPKTGDIFIADGALINRQYFLVYDRYGPWHIYCWATCARAPYLNLVCRVEANSFRLCYRFENPNVGPCAHWQDMDFYFYLPGRALCFYDDSKHQFIPLPLYPNVDQALQALSFSNWLAVGEGNNLMAGNLATGAPSPNPSTQGGFLNWRGRNSHPPEHADPPTYPQSVPSLRPSCVPYELPISGVSGDNQDVSTSGTFSPTTNSRFADPQCIDPRALNHPSPTSASGPSARPESTAAHSDTPQNSLSFGVPSPQLAASTPGSSGSAPASSPDPFVLLTASTDDSDEWPKDQVMRLHETNLNVQDIKEYTREFSKGLKSRGLEVAYCWHCYLEGKPVEECEWTDLRPSTLERHLLPHFELTKFQCPFPECKQGTVTKQQLTLHIERNHPQS